MVLNDLIAALTSATGVLIVLALSFINIPKINLNIWNIIGNNITRDISNKIDQLEDRVDDIDKKLDNHIKDDKVDKVRQNRLRILRFGSDLLNNIKPTKEHEEDIIDGITEYEKYCIQHPEFKNNKAEITIKLIKKDYEDRLLNDDFN